MESIDEQIKELIRKADNAQMTGNTEAMKEYDRQLKILRAAQMAEFKSVYSKDKPKKPKTM